MKLNKTKIITLIRSISKDNKITGLKIEHDVISISARMGIKDLKNNGLKKIIIYFNDWE